jgi:hypothetical protein
MLTRFWLITIVGILCLVPCDQSSADDSCESKCDGIKEPGKQADCYTACRLSPGTPPGGGTVAVPPVRE